MPLVMSLNNRLRFEYLFMGQFLNNIRKDMNAAGFKVRSAEAREWMQRELVKLGQVNRSSITRSSPQSSDLIGNMFFMVYDAKGKDSLPYWDKFPLVLPIELYNDGFLGLNFHYLPINARIGLLDSLQSLVNNDKMDRTTRIVANYRILSGAARFSAFQPCIKRYLSSHIQSRMALVEPKNWEIACFLEAHNFQKATAKQVWGR